MIVFIFLVLSIIFMCSTIYEVFDGQKISDLIPPIIIGLALGAMGFMIQYYAPITSTVKKTIYVSDLSPYSNNIILDGDVWKIQVLKNKTGDYAFDKSDTYRIVGKYNEKKEETVKPLVNIINNDAKYLTCLKKNQIYETMINDLRDLCSVENKKLKNKLDKSN